MRRVMIVGASRGLGAAFATDLGEPGDELLIGSDKIKKDIQNHARVAKMFATCMDDGMRTLKQDGIEKVLQGITDMLQVRAVCIK